MFRKSDPNSYGLSEHFLLLQDVKETWSGRVGSCALRLSRHSVDVSEVEDLQQLFKDLIHFSSFSFSFIPNISFPSFSFISFESSL